MQLIVDAKPADRLRAMAVEKGVSATALVVALVDREWDRRAAAEFKRLRQKHIRRAA